MQTQLITLSKEEIKKINGGATETSPYSLGVAVGEFLGGLILAIGAIRGLKK